MVVQYGEKIRLQNDGFVVFME